MGFFKICFLVIFMLNLTMKVMDQKRCVKEKRSVPWPQDFSGLDTQNNQKTRNGHKSFLPPGFRKPQDSLSRFQGKSWQNLTRSGTQLEFQFYHPSLDLKTHPIQRQRATRAQSMNQKSPSVGSKASPVNNRRKGSCCQTKGKVAL